MSPSAPAPTLVAVEVPGGNAGVAAIAAVLRSDPDPSRSYALVPSYAAAGALRKLRAGLDNATVAGDSVCCPTSGTTGDPRWVVIPRAALARAARERDEAMGGPGAWFIGVPPVTAGGLVAIERGLRTHVAPTAWDGAGHGRFDADEFAEQARAFLDLTAAESVPAFTSLVATQLDRVLHHPTASEVCARFDQVLVGGGPLGERTKQLAAEAAVSVVHSYGATETCGGCVYDGRPVPGTAVRVVAGEIQISGPCVSPGYLDGPLRRTADGWWRSGDRGVLTDGLVQVQGRFDDVVTVKGANVDLGAVQRVLEGVRGVREAAVVATDDPAGGNRLQAYLVGEVAVDAARAKVGAELGSAAVPRIAVVPRLPLTTSGKVDLQRLREDS